MKDRTILVLFICIVVVGAFIGIQEYWRSQVQSKVYERLKLFEIDLNSLTSLQFVSGDITIDCDKENGVWLVGDRSHGMGRADVAIIYQLVTKLKSLGKGTTITAKELATRGLSASEYGLEPPSTEIVAIDNQGRHSWQIGRTTPLGNEVYVREAGKEDIYTVLSWLLSVIPSDPDQLRNRALFAGSPQTVKRLEIRGPGGFIRVVKEPSSEWRIQQPIIAQAEAPEVDAYIKKLYTLRIDDFIADNVSDLSIYGLQGETKQISMGLSDGSSSTLVLGDEIAGRPGYVYVRRADDTSVFAVQDDVMKLLDVNVNRFRNARILSIPKEDVTSVLVKRGDRQLVMGKQPSGNWKITKPVIWSANTAEISSLIDLWSHAVITEFDVSSTNTVPSEWTLEFASSSSGLTNRIDVLPAGNRRDGLFVRLNNEPSLFQINIPVVPDSIIDPLVYKDKHIWKLRKKDVNKLVLHKAGQPEQSVALSDDGVFVATQSSGNSKVDTTALEHTLDRLCDLSTSEYLTYNPRDLDIYGLSKPLVELYVGLADPNELGRVLLIGRESIDGFYSMIKGRDVVFYLDKATVESISSDLVIRPDTPRQVPE